MKFTKSVNEIFFGNGAITYLEDALKPARGEKDGRVVVFVDTFFKTRKLPAKLGLRSSDQIIFVDTTNEPSTQSVDEYTSAVRVISDFNPAAVVGIGGGSVLDTTKAVSNLLGNGGRAADYQGWNLLKSPGVYKIGVPTLSGTGAEASRTCVMMNYEKKLKLGMNSDYTFFDRLILDPDLTASAPREQYFYTGMDTFIHCIESLGGRYRHPMADALSREAMRLCHEVFLSDDMMSDVSREKLMVASHLGGTAIGNSYVGLVHPLSAALSVVLGIHHCEANCIVMNVMQDFYPEAHDKFLRMMDAQNIFLQKDVCAGLNDAGFKDLYEATVIHEVPLKNALGENFRSVLSLETVSGLFGRM